MRYLALVLFLASCAPSLRVIDGDTFVYGGEKLRIMNIDTPEKYPRAKCDEEDMLAWAAKVRFEQLISDGFEVHYSGRRGKWGRPLVTVSVNGKDVGETLINEGYARPWVGRRMPWCEE